MNTLQGWLNLPRASRSTLIPGWGQWDRQTRLLAHSAPSSRALRELPALTAPGHKVCSAMIATFCHHPLPGNYTPTHHSLRQPSGSCCCNYKPQVRWHWGSPEGMGPAEVLSIYGLWRSIPLGSWIYWFPTTKSCSDEASLPFLQLLLEKQMPLNRSVRPYGPKYWGTREKSCCQQ